MSSRLKFRWWNGHQMIEGKHLNVLAKNLKNGKNGEYMQFTGLKDCNGTEIYEGDIVTADDLVCEVRWGKAEWEAAWKSNGMTMGPTLGFRRHEVIGNIHENPELLGD